VKFTPGPLSGGHESGRLSEEVRSSEMNCRDAEKKTVHSAEVRCSNGLGFRKGRLKPRKVKGGGYQERSISRAERGSAL